jgi:hypothetical protein
MRRYEPSGAPSSITQSGSSGAREIQYPWFGKAPSERRFRLFMMSKNCGVCFSKLELKERTLVLIAPGTPTRGWLGPTSLNVYGRSSLLNPYFSRALRARGGSEKDAATQKLVASQGFEPQYAESESAVLPLNDEAIRAGDRLRQAAIKAETKAPPVRPTHSS